MPELPEVEIVTRGLRPVFTGKKIVRIQAYVSKLRTPLTIQDEMNSLARVSHIRRRGKYILLELENHYLILVHLGMTGSFRLKGTDMRMKHDHVVFYLDSGEKVVYNDVRRFGIIELHRNLHPGDLPDALTKLAPEPLTEDFNLEWMTSVCSGSRRPVKNLIMDNRKVTGVGNIYASESLYKAGIHPTRTASSLNQSELQKLIKAIKQVLKSAIRAGGSTIRNYRRPDGNEGKFARELQVYNRSELPCNQCTMVIQKIRMSGRSTYYCPSCQK